MKEIVLYGAGGHCYAAIELIRSLGIYTPKIIFDDAPKQSEILTILVEKFSNQDVVGKSLCISIGTNISRKKIARLFHADFPSFVHASAAVYPSVKIGKGTLVHPNVVLDAAVSIGNFCIVNNSATVSHNVTAGDFVHIAIQAVISGGVSIGEGTLIGAGSVILPEISIGKWATIGAGAVVTKDVPDNAVVYGNPSKIVRYNSNV